MTHAAINPTRYDNIPSYVAKSGDALVHAVIETPAGTRHKYAFEPDYGLMRLKMTLAEGLAWPYDYGFVPQTIADDGDPIDILVLNDAATFSGCLIDVRVIGSILLKQDGVENDRLVGCPPRQPGVALKTDEFDDIDDLPKALLAGIEHFLVEYSSEEGHHIELSHVVGPKKALHAIDRAHKAFAKNQRRAS